MDPLKFKQLTEPLLKYSPRLERDILVKPTKPRACDYCELKVVDQIITCDAHKLDTAQQHFKHKCHTCKHTVFDGSFKLNPHLRRPASMYYVPVVRTPKLQDPYRIKRPIGRPRKNTVL
jgi:hypothetical protein